MKNTSSDMNNKASRSIIDAGIAAAIAVAIELTLSNQPDAGAMKCPGISPWVISARSQFNTNRIQQLQTNWGIQPGWNQRHGSQSQDIQQGNIK